MFVRATTRTRRTPKVFFLAIHLQPWTTKERLQGIEKWIFFLGIQKGFWALFVDKFGLFWE